MCHAKKCRTCGKSTWTGCGAHVAQVRARVPAEQWCAGHLSSDDGTPDWLRRFFGQAGRR